MKILPKRRRLLHGPVRLTRSGESGWKISDFVAILTIIGGIASFSYSAYKDRELKRSEYADNVRRTASQLLGKTSSLHDVISLSIIDAKQRVVETKLKLIDKYEPPKVMHALWGTVLDAEARALVKLSSLQSDSSYLAFYTFSPNTKKCIDSAIYLVQSDVRQGFANVRRTIEKVRVGLPENPNSFSPASLYNDIAEPLDEMEKAGQGALNALLTPIERHLTEVIARSNDSLTADKLQAEEVPCK